MEAYIDADFKTGDKKMSNLGNLFSSAMSECDKVMDKMDMVSTKAQELLKMTDWKDFARKIYEENT